MMKSVIASVNNYIIRIRRLSNPILKWFAPVALALDCLDAFDRVLPIAAFLYAAVLLPYVRWAGGLPDLVASAARSGLF